MKKYLIAFTLLILIGCGDIPKNEQGQSNFIYLKAKVKNTSYDHSVWNGDKYRVSISTKYGSFISGDRDIYSKVSEGDSVSLMLKEVNTFGATNIEGKNYILYDVRVY